MSNICVHRMVYFMFLLMMKTRLIVETVSSVVVHVVSGN